MIEIIFMNYRRSDDPGTVGRIYDKMSTEFGEAALFMDVEGKIPIGHDYVEKLKAQVALCQVFLAFIGPRWLNASDATGEARLTNSDDWVRIELATALDAGDDKLVIPVLIGDTQMPQPEQLPEDIREIVKRQAARVTYARFASDTSGLIKQIRQAQAERDRERVASQDREQRLQLEKERLEAQAKLASSKKLSSEELKKAEELASWEFIKDRQKPDELRTHIKRFPRSSTARFAAVQLEALVWTLCKASGTEADLNAFAGEFPKSPHLAEAMAIVKSKRDTATAGARFKREQASAFWRCIVFSVSMVALIATGLVLIDLNSRGSGIGPAAMLPFIVMLLVWWYYSVEDFDDMRAYWFHLAVATTWFGLLSPWIAAASLPLNAPPTIPVQAALLGAVAATLFYTYMFYFLLFYYPMRRGSISNAGWARMFYAFVGLSIGHLPITFGMNLPEVVKGPHIVFSFIIILTIKATTSIEWDDDSDFYRVVSQRFVLAGIASFAVGVLASLAGSAVAMVAASIAGVLVLLVSLPPLYGKAPAKAF